MRQPLADPSDPDVAALLSRIRGQRWGRVSALYGMLLHQPRVAEGWLGLGSAIRRDSGLTDRTRELAICLVGRICDQSYEWENHAPLALSAGATHAELEALLDRERCDSFSDRERTVLDLVESVARDEVDDERFARAASVLTPHELVELVATASYYVGTARFLSAFGIEAGAPDLVDSDQKEQP